jgi:hypothetical protein
MAPGLRYVMSPVLVLAMLLALGGCRSTSQGYHYRGYGSPGVRGAFENDQGYNVGYTIDKSRPRPAAERHYYTQGSYIHGSAPSRSTYVSYTRYEPRSYVTVGIGSRGYYDGYRSRGGFGLFYGRDYGYGHRGYYSGCETYSHYGSYRGHHRGHYHGSYGGYQGRYYCD